MLTIPNAVEEVIKKKPFLEGALVEGLINLSALARQLKPEIEKKVGKEVNDSAVIMALNRLVPRLELMSAMKFKKVVENIGDTDKAGADLRCQTDSLRLTAGQRCRSARQGQIV